MNRSAHRATYICSIAASFVMLASSCDQQPTSTAAGTQPELPRVEVKLPPSPSFKKEHPAEQYPNGAYSVYGVEKQLKKLMNQQVRVQGFVVDVYQCPPCPKKADCKPCSKPHFWLGDKIDTPKEKALLITDYLPDDPKLRKRLEHQYKSLTAGAGYVITGTASITSPSGFSRSEGLIVFAEAAPLATAAE